MARILMYANVNTSGNLSVIQSFLWAQIPWAPLDCWFGMGKGQRVVAYGEIRRLCGAEAVSEAGMIRDDRSEFLPLGFMLACEICFRQQKRATGMMRKISLIS